MHFWKQFQWFTTLLLIGCVSAFAGLDTLPEVNPGGVRAEPAARRLAQRGNDRTPSPISIAQEDQLQGLKHTLGELVEWALRHSDLIASHSARVEDRRYAASQARTWPNPSLDFSAGRSGVSSLTGPLYELALAQPLPISGKQGLRGDILDLESETWRVRLAAAETGLALEVIRLSYEYSVQRRIVELIEARQQRFELFRSYMAGRVFASPQQKAQSRLVEQRFKRLTSDAVQARATLQASLEKLKVFVAFEPGHYPEIDVPWFAGKVALDEQAETARAIANNLNLALQRVSLKSAAVERNLAAREAWPELSVAAFYGKKTYDDAERSAGGSLSLDLPLWNRNQAGIRSAQYKALAEERLLAFEEKQLRAEFRKALVEYEAARKIIAQYPHALLAELATQLQEIEEEFRKDRVDLLTFLELDGEFGETSSRVFEAQFALVTKIIELMALAGERSPLERLRLFVEGGAS